MSDNYECHAYCCKYLDEDGTCFCMYFKTHRTTIGCPELKRLREEVEKLNQEWEEENKKMNEAAEETYKEYKEVSEVFAEWDKAFDAEKRRNELREKITYSQLYKIARKMHEWIFLNTADHEAVFKEIGLTPEENEYLGDLGSIRITL